MKINIFLKIKLLYEKTPFWLRFGTFIITLIYSIIKFSIEDVPKFIYLFQNPELQAILINTYSESISTENCYQYSLRIRNKSAVTTNSMKLFIQHKDKQEFETPPEQKTFLVESIPPESLSPEFRFILSFNQKGQDTVYFKLVSFKNSSDTITLSEVLTVN